MSPTSFIDAIAPLVTEHERLIPLLAAVLARMSAIVFLAPGFGEQTIPVRIRLTIVFALVAVAAPGLRVDVMVSDSAKMASLIGAEAMNGFIIGMSLRAVIFILQTAGAVIAQHMSLTQLFGVSLVGDRESALSSILIVAMLAAAASAGLHVEIAAVALHTYDVFPIGVWPAGADVGAWSTAKAAAILNIAFSLGLPFVLLGLAYSLALAAASRAMPQLSAVFVGVPASLFAGLALFAATALVIIDRASELFATAISMAPWGLQ